jgi:hypothetical protein
MRVILDTNILVSALLVQSGTPGTIYRMWADGAFTLLTCQRQILELRRTLQKPTLAARIRPHYAGRLVNELKELAVMVDPLPRVIRSPDPDDDFLLAAAQIGRANYLITGDKSGLLSLIRHKGTRIVFRERLCRPSYVILCRYALWMEIHVAFRRPSHNFRRCSVRRSTMHPRYAHPRDRRS